MFLNGASRMLQRERLQFNLHVQRRRQVGLIKERQNKNSYPEMRNRGLHWKR